MAVALVFLGPAPAAGVVFLALALGISGGAFIGRYHYAMDVLIGMAAAFAWFALTLL
jgi:hypothetical protein